MTLHEAIEKLLRQTGQPMTAREIADGLNKNKWYVKGDQSQIKTSQITARVDDHHELFEIDRSTSPLKVKLFGRQFPATNKTNSTPSVMATTKVAATVKPTATTVSTDLTSLLKTFTKNLFDPLADLESSIADSSGNYILCLRPKSKLPTVSISPTLTNFNGLQVIYTGIAGGSLRSRDYRQHFRGNNAGRSTLRKSLGVLFGYKQIPRDKDPNTGKTKFGIADEMELTSWMCDNLLMFTLPTSDFDSVEIKLINHFNPPLNLKDNHNSINADFRQLLSSLRSRKK